MRHIVWILCPATVISTLTIPAGHAQVAAGRPLAPLILPVRYDEHRYIVAPVTEGGDTLYLYTDTGSGINALWPATVQRIGLILDSIVRGRDTLRFTALPPFRADASIPFGSPNPEIGRKILVVDPINFASDRDGLLGTDWFAGKVWTFDYPKHQLLQQPAGYLPQHSQKHLIPVAFQTDSSGRRTQNHPRIQVLIDGESLDLLFDTGAMTALTPAARAALRDGRPERRATSFIVQSVFDRWRKRHPQWRVIEGADQLFGKTFPMIEVPTIQVGGFDVGPVWFTARPDENFARLSRQVMDRPIVGALGGSALQYLQVTIDYPRALAAFARP